MESAIKKKQRAKRIIKILKKQFPDAACKLTFRNPLELLIKTILSAQCTDARVNQISESLFRQYPRAEDFANAPLRVLETAIRSTGFFHNKARHIQRACKILIERFDGEVPRQMQELLELPGVGRKTANVILGNAYSIPAMVVDTHVLRLTFLLKLTRHTAAEKVEADLMDVIPKEHWVAFSHWISDHGRQTCIARRPQCDRCVLVPECPSSRIHLN
jgi:endonuclease-3